MSLILNGSTEETQQAITKLSNVMVGKGEADQEWRTTEFYTEHFDLMEERYRKYHISTLISVVPPRLDYDSKDGKSELFFKAINEVGSRDWHFQQRKQDNWHLDVFAVI